MLKTCKKCGLEKPLTEFHKCKSSSDGLKLWCKGCVKAYNKTYYEAKGRELRRDYYSAHKAESYEQGLAWRRQNPERAREICRASHARNKSNLLAYDQGRYAANRGYFSEKNERWRKAHPLERAAGEAKRRAQKAETSVGDVDYQAILSRDGWVCHICGGQVAPETLSFDHVIPLAKRGPHTESNIKVAHRSCNSGKKDRLMNEVKHESA